MVVLLCVRVSAAACPFDFRGVKRLTALLQLSVDDLQLNRAVSGERNG
jgi:hypothetical protein